MRDGWRITGLVSCFLLDSELHTTHILAYLHGARPSTAA